MKRGREEDEAAQDGAAKRARSGPLRNPFRCARVEHAQKTSIQHLVLDLIFGGTADTSRYLGAQPELPGPLAIALTRRTLKAVASQPYMVCEKSDGERALMLLVSKPTRSVLPGAYLLNRAFDVQSFEGGQEYASLISPEGPSLLDGELIIRGDDAGSGTGATAVYMMFDCITCNGRDYASSRLMDRLTALGDAVRRPFRDTDAKLLADGKAGLPLYLIGKTMLDATKVRGVVDKMSTVSHAPHSGHGGAGAAASAQHSAATAPLESEMGSATSTSSSDSLHRVYRDGIRVNNTDGLIFTPCNLTYRELFRSATSGTPVLKWKFLDENTIDYRLTRGDLEKATERAHSAAAVDVPLQVALGGSRGDVAVAKCSLTMAECDAYSRLCDRLGRDSVIVECGYDADNSSWRIRRVRDSKMRANHITTAWSTLEVAAEAITQEELVRLLGSASGGAGGAGGTGRGPTGT